MITRKFQNEELPLLGFGLMRLPKNEDGSIDMETFREMVKIAREGGIRYFDTAWPYHDGKSELAIGEILKDYPRDSFYLADKFPGHQHSDHYDAKAMLDTQLKKCRVSYFDFYLLHNVCENSYDVYVNEKWHVIPDLIEAKKQGKIKHLGFSCHSNLEGLKEFLEFCKANQYEMEFCQIQLNYLDWTLQEAKEKVDLLNEYKIPIWVMEPIRGGKLAMDVRNAFRFVQNVPGVTMILSGMSNIQQMKENVETFSAENPLQEEEYAELMARAEAIKNSVPCTACEYCMKSCPMELPIPKLIKVYNDLKFERNITPVMFLESLPENKTPNNCLQCGACMSMCPQAIEIPKVLKKLSDLYEAGPSWKKICEDRAKNNPT